MRPFALQLCVFNILIPKTFINNLFMPDIITNLKFVPKILNQNVRIYGMNVDNIKATTIRKYNIFSADISGSYS